MTSTSLVLKDISTPSSSSRIPDLLTIFCFFSEKAHHQSPESCHCPQHLFHKQVPSLSLPSEPFPIHSIALLGPTLPPTPLPVEPPFRPTGINVNKSPLIGSSSHVFSIFASPISSQPPGFFTGSLGVLPQLSSIFPSVLHPPSAFTSCEFPSPPVPPPSPSLRAPLSP